MTDLFDRSAIGATPPECDGHGNRRDHRGGPGDTAQGQSIGDHAATDPGPKAVASPLFYGSGDAPKRGALTQTEVHSEAEKGAASLPQYWSTGGYGILVIGQTDNEPASWKAGPDGSVKWTVTGPGADLYLMPARNLYDWLSDDAELTGFAPVPPRWSAATPLMRPLVMEFPDNAKTSNLTDECWRARTCSPRRSLAREAASEQIRCGTGGTPGRVGP